MTVKPLTAKDIENLNLLVHVDQGDGRKKRVSMPVLVDVLNGEVKMLIPRDLGEVAHQDGDVEDLPEVQDGFMTRTVTGTVYLTDLTGQVISKTPEGE